MRAWASVMVLRKSGIWQTSQSSRTRDGAHLRAHLEYISRNGQLELEGADGALIIGRRSESTDRKTSLEDTLRQHAVAV